MGRRTVKLSYQVDVDIDVTLEWPEGGGRRLFGEDEDDPREMKTVVGATPRDQALLDVVLREDNDAWSAIELQALEQHGTALQEDLVWERVEEEVRRRFRRDDRDSREIMASLHEVRRRAREASFVIERKAQTERAFSDEEVAMIAYATLAEPVRKAVERLLPPAPLPDPFAHDQPE